MSISIFDLPDTATRISSKGIGFSSGDDCLPGPSSLSGLPVRLREAGTPVGLSRRSHSAVGTSAPQFQARECARPSARAPGVGRGNRADQSAGPLPTRAQDWTIRSSLSPGVGGPYRERPGIGAPAAPESQGRVRGLASAAGAGLARPRGGVAGDGGDGGGWRWGGGGD